MLASEYTTYSWSPRSPKLEGTLPTGPMGWSRLWVRALATQHDADDPDDDQHDEQGRLNQWAHWARAQGPRIFFLFDGPQLAVVK